MRIIRSLVLAAVAVTVPVAAMAQLPTQTLDYTGPSGVVSGNLYVGPYNGTLGGVAYDIFCVDGLTSVDTSPYQVYVTPLTAGANIASGDYTKQTSVSTYMQAAWLAMQFRTDNKGEWGAIHQAIWDLTGGLKSGWYTGYSSTSTAVLDWKAQAGDNYGDVIASDWSVLSPEDATSQEFLVRTSVPEPGTWLMVLAGFLGVGVVAFRRRFGIA